MKLLKYNNCSDNINYAIISILLTGLISETNDLNQYSATSQIHMYIIFHPIHLLLFTKMFGL